MLEMYDTVLHWRGDMWLTKSRLDTAGTEQFSKLKKRYQSRDLTLTFHSGNEVPCSNDWWQKWRWITDCHLENCIWKQGKAFCSSFQSPARAVLPNLQSSESRSSASKMTRTFPSLSLATSQTLKKIEWWRGREPSPSHRAGEMLPITRHLPGSGVSLPFKSRPER